MNKKVQLASLKLQRLFIAPILIFYSSRMLRALAVLAAVALVSTAARAQADFEKGYQAFQSYHGSDFDTVNLANGNLVLNIPLLSYEQRGNVPPITISIRSNSTTFQSTPPLVNGPADTKQHEVASGVIGAPWGQPHVMISPGGLFWKEERVVTSTKTAIGPEYLVRFVAIDDSGATHSLGGSIANSAAGYVPGIRYSVDGSGLMLQPGTTASGSVLVDRKGNTGGLVDLNGNAITLYGPCATHAGSGDFFNPSLPSWEGYAHGTASASSITDTIGRVIPNPSYLPPLENYSCLVDTDASYHPATTTEDLGYGKGGACREFYESSSDTNNPYTFQIPNYTPKYYAETYEFPGENGANVPLTFCYAQLPVSASIPQVNGPNLENETINEKWWLLTSVTLPNSTFWQFGYDNYGQVETVVMPTGAMVTYKYAPRLACGNPPGQIPVVGTPIWPYSNILSSRMVTQKSVYLSSTASEPIEIWQYDNNVGSGWMGAPTATAEGILSPGGANQGTVTVTDPLGNATIHTFTLEGGSTCGPYETKTQYYQGSSQLLKEVDTAYSNTGADYANPTNFSNYIAVGVFPNVVTTTLPSRASSLVKQDIYQYDTFGSYQDYKGLAHPFSFGQVLTSTESDFGSISPSRSTLHTKQWQSNWNYYARNLIDLPFKDTVFSGPVALGNQIAQTSYTYDLPGQTANLATWGLSTSVTRWLKGSTTSPTTYDYYGAIGTTAYMPAGSAAVTTGMPIKKVDALGNPTSFSYDSTGLYLNKITYADGSSEQPQYDNSTGLLSAHTDVSGKTTYYTYDPMRRLTGVIYPDSGWESLAYNDAIGSLSVTFSKGITQAALQAGQICKYPNNGCLVKIALADGLGRLTQTQLTSDPNGAVYTDTAYDNLGRVARVSNPYRSSGEAAYGITSYTYDALSRQAIVTAPDGTTKQSCFNGIKTVGQSNCNTNLWGGPVAWEDDADENGNDWQRSQNGLGQMTHAFEPNGTSSSPSMETDYSYDMLNNLLAVNQWGVIGTSGARAARTFTYDSLSRLATSSNPETGMTAYAYDLNSNLTSRTDARGITTTYQYDEMNRLWGKSYSDQVTPSSYYVYGAKGAQALNEVGRLIYAWTQRATMQAPTAPPTAAPASGFLTKRSIQPYGYDPIGRLLGEDQYVLTTKVATPQYSYDLAGNLAYFTDGATPTATPSVQLPSCTVGVPSWFNATNLTYVNCYDGAGRLQTLTSNWAISGSAAQSLFSTTPSPAMPSYAAFGGLSNAIFGNGGLTLNRTYDNRLRITGETDIGGAGGGATRGTAAIAITGAEQSH